MTETTIPEAAPLPATVAAAPPPTQLFGSADPARILERAQAVADALAPVIRDQQLFKRIGNRDHVLVEGWTFCGSMLGVFPITAWTRPTNGPDGEHRPPTFKAVERRNSDGEPYTERVLDRPGSGGWEARIEARTLAGELVSAAESECTWSETTWEERASYALRSMAQTRATSKAMRQPLGFVVQLAGFAATPAEEMDSSGTRRASSDDTTGAPRRTGWKCPACSSEKIYDNRRDPQREERKWPTFRCGNKSCTGGRNGQPWASWNQTPQGAGLTDEKAAQDSAGDEPAVPPGRRGWVLSEVAGLLDGDLDAAQRIAAAASQAQDITTGEDGDITEEEAAQIVGWAYAYVEAEGASITLEQLLEAAGLKLPVTPADIETIDAAVEKLAAPM